MRELNETVSAVKAPGRPAVSPEKRAEMKKLIADTAEHLFQTEGFSQISMRRIAKEIGCAPMTLYKYYDAKIDILRTLWGGVFVAVFASLDKTPRNPSRQRYLTDLGIAYVDYWLKHPEQYRLVFMAEGVTQPDVSVFLNNPEIIRKFNIFTETIAGAGPSKDASDNLKPKLDFFLSTLHGITHNHVTISGYPWSSPEQQIQLAVRAITQHI